MAKNERGRSRGRPGRGDRADELARPLGKVLKRLPETQREVLEWRMGLKDGHPKNLAETARELGLTMHEAREIEQRAFEHIREVVPLEQLQKLLRD
ncbi:MAG: sigma factor-like helix-turn-helix DNA-binding protein [Nitriliruptorales bacterium]|nr:sigma factor-like helix-turn-helix DNA-binding protein [Nitriliruptorales bacterium]